MLEVVPDKFFNMLKEQYQILAVPGERTVLRKTFGIEELVSEMELFLHGWGQRGS